MNFPRESGLLLHPTSLAGPYGIGDLGAEAYRFVDWLAAARQTLWQVLPLGPTGFGDSPYQCFSAFAGNTLLISPDKLVEDGLLDASALENSPDFPTDRIDFGGVITWKNALLTQAFENYRQHGSEETRTALADFCANHADWLEDYALFRAVKDAQGGANWNQWPKPLRLRDESALAQAREELRETIEAQKFYQFLFFKQWHAVKNYCHTKGISIIGDIPIFVAYDSADVWCAPQEFKLDKNGKPLVVAGVPPDYFSKTGQLWGNPIYNWEDMEANGFNWWLRRAHATLELVDILRIDHFRGFAASWEIPGGDKTAERGQWVNVPGEALFTTIREKLGDIPIIAEDLGVITPDVEALRDGFGFPGMHIFQFGFGSDMTHTDLPHNYIENCVAYTGTHDNDTLVGWFTSAVGKGSTRDAEQIEKERKFCLEYLESDGTEINWDFIRVLLASAANTILVPLQDVLGLGSEARMNLPASESGNWGWRYQPDDLTPEIASRLADLVTAAQRGPQPAEPTQLDANVGNG